MNKPVSDLKSSTRILGLILLLVMAIGILSGCSSRPAAPAQVQFPTRPITYVIPFDPGGGSDLIAQEQIPALKNILGQDVVLDYKAGEGGAVGWAEVARSSPDGYTMVAVNFPHIVIQPMYGEVNYKTEQLDVIAVFSRAPVGLAVLNDSPYNTLDEFLAEAKANPGKLKVGIPSKLGTQHIAALLIEKMTGTQFELVFYTGSSPQLTAFLAGEVEAVIANTGDFAKYKEDVRVLGLATDSRFPDLKDVPTFKEQGYDLIAATDRAVAVPAGTPAEVVKKLETAFLEVTNSAEFQASQQEEGYAKIVMGHDESKAYIAELIETYKQLADSIE